MGYYKIVISLLYRDISGLVLLLLFTKILTYSSANVLDNNDKILNLLNDHQDLFDNEPYISLTTWLLINIFVSTIYISIILFVFVGFVITILTKKKIYFLFKALYFVAICCYSTYIIIWTLIGAKIFVYDYGYEYATMSLGITILGYFVFIIHMIVLLLVTYKFSFIKTKKPYNSHNNYLYFIDNYIANKFGYNEVSHYSYCKLV